MVSPSDLRSQADESDALRSRNTVADERGQHLGHLLRRAFVLSTDCAHACLTDDVALREVAAVALLAERAPISQRELGELLHINRSIMVKLVDSLEAKGLVLRERKAGDRRSYALQLTDKGHRVREELLGELSRGDEQLTARLTPEECSELNRALMDLLDDPRLVPIASLAEHSGYLIAQGHRLLRAKALERLTPVGLDPRDFGILSALDALQPCSQNQLAARMGISPPAAVTWLEDLETRGLVSRDRNRADRRLYDVRLTPQGAQRLTAARHIASGLERDVAASLGDRYPPLRRLLLKLTQ